MSKIVLTIYWIAYKLNQWKVPLLPELINKIFVRLLFGCQLQMGAKIGKNVNLGNGGLAIVIHRHAVLEDNVIVAPSVTIAGTSQKVGAPYIGENSFIGTGARILGPVKVGKNCYIGANAVVINDIPDNTMVAGIPAKIIRTNIDINEYN